MGILPCDMLLMLGRSGSLHKASSTTLKRITDTADRRLATLLCCFVEVRPRYGLHAYSLSSMIRIGCTVDLCIIARKVVFFRVCCNFWEKAGDMGTLETESLGDLLR